MALIDFNIQLPKDWLAWFGRKRSILLVEDDPMTATLIRAGAEGEGLAVTHAEDAQTALGILRSNGKRFAAALIDVNLSGGGTGSDGWALRRNLIDHWPRMLVVMMSASRSFLMGFPGGDVTMVLEKPASYHGVFRELKRFMR